ncbi:MAG: hypothetical protein PVF47_02205 [Anaerolineae bacterium]|jgi:hypothetical protein
MREPPVRSDSPGWKQARRTAFVQDVMATFTQRTDGLMDFYDTSQKLNLSHVHYRDLQEVPLDQIVGSVGRYTDFTRAFFPRKDHLRERWQRIEKMVAAGRPLPPIELFQVGQAYFVRDGNHRVSVARQRGFTTLQARVWEYETAVPLAPDSDIDELLCRTAQADFLERTNIQRLQPELEIELTEPGGYEELLQEIESYQAILSQIDRQEISFEEAVGLWCELRYLPIVQIMREGHVLDEFPGRTETDLYLWLCRNQQTLQSSYGHQVLMQEAADDLAERFGRPIFFRRVKVTLDRTANRIKTWMVRRRKAPQPPLQDEE